MKKKEKNKNPIQPVSGTKVPRFAGPSTFARLPEMRDVKSCDVAIVGIPFDAGTSYRPGARFGPQSIRQDSRHLRTNYHPNYDIEPFKVQQVADAGDIVCNPFNINEAIQQIEKGALDLLNKVEDKTLCPIYSGVAFLDRCLELEKLKSLKFYNVNYPLLMIPFISRASEIMSKKILVQYDNSSFLLNFDKSIFSKNIDKQAQSLANVVSIEFIENKNSFSEQDWKELYKLSEETFVDESDSSKTKAAGAGLTDND